MSFFAILGSILSALGYLPKVIDFISGVMNSISSWYKSYQKEKTSKELAEAIKRATDESNKDTRDLERLFNPNRDYPKQPPSNGGK